ncbi:MAG: hypothetical protein U0599_12330 [Vicinamibacteria bacterium]
MKRFTAALRLQLELCLGLSHGPYSVFCAAAELAGRGGGLLRRPGLGRRLGLLRRQDLHHRVALLARRLLDDDDFGAEATGSPDLGVDDLAAAEITTDLILFPSARNRSTFLRLKLKSCSSMQPAGTSLHDLDVALVLASASRFAC